MKVNVNTEKEIACYAWHSMFSLILHFLKKAFLDCEVFSFFDIG
jgi:hypothetical protein